MEGFALPIGDRAIDTRVIAAWDWNESGPVLTQQIRSTSLKLLSIELAAKCTDDVLIE